MRALLLAALATQCLKMLHSYQMSKMPPIKGGSFDRAFHKSEIEGMMERAAAVPGPGEVYAISLRQLAHTFYFYNRLTRTSNMI
jgi:hypothetical protein